MDDSRQAGGQDNLNNFLEEDVASSDTGVSEEGGVAVAEDDALLAEIDAALFDDFDVLEDAEDGTLPEDPCEDDAGSGDNADFEGGEEEELSDGAEVEEDAEHEDAGNSSGLPTQDRWKKFSNVFARCVASGHSQADCKESTCIALRSWKVALRPGLTRWTML